MHNKFTVIARVRPGQQGQIAAILKDHTFIYPGAAQDPFGFAQISALHFASLCLYDDPEDGWSLLFEHNVDGEIGPYLRDMISVAKAQDDGAFLLGLYAHCEGFEGKSLDGLRSYMNARVIHPAAGFISAVNMTRDQIRLDSKVYDVVDQTMGPAGVVRPVAEMQEAVFKALDADPETRDLWYSTDDPGTKQPPMSKIKSVVGLIFHAIGFLVLALWNLIPERTAPQDQARPDSDLRRSLEMGEDFVPTNHMVSVVYLHTDPGRQLAKRMAFGLLRNLVALLFRNGFLGEINTIHFAHWSFTNNNRRLIFVSNFDGSWRSYLDDFTLKASNGLNLAWAHSMGFPKTWVMLFGGASKGPQFIDYARRSMVPTLVWYSAYPSVSVTNIGRNRDLRAALIDARDGNKETKWPELV